MLFSCFSAEQAAPLSAVPAQASGTFNPLCKVLCILQSLYLCSVGSKPDMLTFGGYTPNFKLQSQATLLLDPDRHIRMAQQTASVEDSNQLQWTIPGHFLSPSQARHSHQVHLPTASAENHLSQQDPLFRQVVPDCLALLVHSPLLKQSQLLAIPPPSDMLKFSGLLPALQVIERSARVCLGETKQSPANCPVWTPRTLLPACLRLVPLGQSVGWEQQFCSNGPFFCGNHHHK